MGLYGVTETYGYDADGERVIRSGTITLYFRDLVEEDVGGEQRELYPFKG